MPVVERNDISANDTMHACRPSSDCNRRRQLLSFMDRLNEWTERKGRGWEGDVPPVEGLTMWEEVDKLLAQAS